MNCVYVVSWYNVLDAGNGILGVFTSREKADRAVLEDELEFPLPDYEIDYDVSEYTLDEKTL